MRVLHTSDWHLGKSLSGVARLPEHAAFCDEIVDLCEQERIDAVLLTGDVFDTYNPPIDAEELFFDTMARLGAGGRRAVVVIAGNHDSPDRLSAAVPLASTHGVWILGRPDDVPRGQPRGEGRVRLLDSGPSRLLLGLPGCDAPLHLAALPYPSEARLKKLLAPRLEERDLQRAYSRRIGALLGELAGHAPEGAVSLAASHLAITACMPSPSERALVGGAYQVDAAELPEVAYTALGHLHQPQDVPGAPGPARYAGAPFAFRMSERDHAFAHTIVDVAPGGPAELHHLPVRAGRDLVLWEASSVAEVVAGVEAGLHEGALVELRLTVAQRLGHAEMATLQKLPRTFLRIRVQLPEAPTVETPARHLHTLAPGDLFASFYRHQQGTEPEAELVALFEDLLEGGAP